MDEYEDDRELQDVEPGEPLGAAKVTFDVPMPTVEQVTGEVARQLIANDGYRGGLRELVSKALRERVTELVSERATPLIEEMLTKPLQPTDGFGQPIGEPTSLQGLLAAQVQAWGGELVNAQGQPDKGNGYGTKPASRMAWALGQIVNGELKAAVDKEVKEIVAKLKGDAASIIAKRIGDQVAATVLK